MLSAIELLPWSLWAKSRYGEEDAKVEEGEDRVVVRIPSSFSDLSLIRLPGLAIRAFHDLPAAEAELHCARD